MRFIVFVESIVFGLGVIWVQMKMVVVRRNHSVKAHLQMNVMVVVV